MPARAIVLTPRQGPLAQFGLQLRKLRNGAPAGRPTSIDDLVKMPWAIVGRAAIYSALAGKTLPSRETLATMVRAWAPDPNAVSSAWMDRRDQCAADLAQPGTTARTSKAMRADLTSPDRASLTTAAAELRKLRTQAGLSLRQLAPMIHYSPAHISKIENGRKRPTLDFMRSVETALGQYGRLLGTAEAH